MEYKILFTTPVLGYPAFGGPTLRIENSIKALNSISELHIICREKKSSITTEAISFYRQTSKTFKFAPSSIPGGSSFFKISLIIFFKIINKIYRFAKNKDIVDFNTLFLGSAKDDAKFILSEYHKNSCNVIWLGYGNVSFDLLQELRLIDKNVKIVCDTDSVWSRFVLRELPFIKDPVKYDKTKQEGEKKALEEADMVKLSNVVTAVSQVDLDYYSSLTSKSTARIFSNVIDLKNYNYEKSVCDMGEYSVYLAGTFWENSPMELAARWLIDDIMPIVWKLYPSTKLFIVGKDSRVILSDVENERVTITGRVRSVLPYLCNATVVTVPLSFESGTRYKILEAGACKKAVVSTTLGAEGIKITDGKDILIADTKEEFAESIIKIFENKEFSSILSNNLYRLVENSYSLEKLKIEGRLILEELLDG